MKEELIEEFISRLRSVYRFGIDKLIEWMETNGFFEAPCSAQHHLSKPSGLLEHSINVYHTMYDLAITLNSPVPVDSIIITALLHDLGKCGQFGKPGYMPNMVKDGRPTKDNPEQKYKQSETKPYLINPDLLYIPHEVRSIQIASQFIKLTEDENWAILMHNGLYGDFKYSIQGKETPLYLLLHMADMWCSRVIEKEEGVIE